jgi:hypothetical protein
MKQHYFFAKQDSLSWWPAVAILFLFHAWPSSILAQTITGTVFRDLNASGVRQSSGTFIEPGAAGVQVRAFDDDDPIGTPTSMATTSSTGVFTLSGLTNGTRYRLEFSWADPLLFPGAAGGTSVQFVQAPATNVWAEVNFPEDYCQSAPSVTLPQYINGLPSGNAANDPAIYSVAFDATGLNANYTTVNGVQGTGPVPATSATISQVGSVWGNAYDAPRQRVFFSTMLKRHCGMADGPGFIYVITNNGTSGTYASKFNLQGVVPANGGASINFGSVCRGGSCVNASGNTGISSDYTLSTDKTQPSVDLDAYAKVGAMSYGDIDIQPGTDLLWAVNTFENSLMAINIAPTTLPGTVNRYFLSALPGWPTCSTGQLRPWALAFYHGKGYLGVTCDASTSQNDADLRCYVLEFDPNNVTAGFTTKLGPFDPNHRRSGFSNTVKFHYWRNVYQEPPMVDEGYFLRYSQPLLSDIEFDVNGNMTLAVMDRFSHQIGDANYKPISQNTSTKTTQAFGELLFACLGSGGAYTLEGGTGCGGSSEFYNDGSGDCASESITGGLALLPGRSEVIAMTFDPFPGTGCGQTYWNTQGFTTFNTTSGQVSDWYAVYRGTAPLIGKANGLGDVTLLCQPAPIEIGNYVWLDADSDGLQDPGESALDGITVELWADTDGNAVVDAKVAQTMTALGGRYLFSDSGANAYGTENWTFFLGDNDRVMANTAYEIRVPLNQSALSNYVLSLGNSTASGSITTNNARTDLRDSDAAAVFGVATIGVTTAAAGQNNHSLDFGFRPMCVMNSITATPGACAPATNLYNLSGTVTFTNAPATGLLMVQVSGGGSQVFNAPFNNPIQYQITGQNSNGAATTVTATFSADAACTAATTYTAPANCLCVPPVLTTEDVSFCIGSSVDLQQLVVGNQPPGVITFYLTLADAQSGQNALLNHIVRPLATTTYYLRSTVNEACFTTTSASVTAVGMPILSTMQGSVCPGGSIDLGSLVTAASGTVSFYATRDNANTGQSPLPTTVVAPTTATHYYVRCVDNSNAASCAVVAEITVVLTAPVCVPITVTGPN